MATERHDQEVATEKPTIAEFSAVLVYNGNDHDSVVAIYDELIGRGIRPWIDSRDHRPGDDWRIGFSSALKNTPVALVFFGPNGTGPWQDEEIPAIHTQCVARKVRVIPVVLPGGSIPDDMLFAAKSAVQFRGSAADAGALDQLEFGITGRNPRERRGRYEILAEVASAERCCFLAVSHATSREIYEIMLDAAVDAGLTVKQPREFTPEAHNVFDLDVVVAIRSAMVVVADGTPNPQTNKPDADVMYETGLAEAFAKPIVFVSTPQENALPLPVFVCDGSCSRIDYDPTEVNIAGPLREELAKRLREIHDGMPPPHLVPDNDLGLSVAYSEMLHHRVMFWKPFEQIIHFGLTIKRDFGEALKHVYKMQQIMELAIADANAARIDGNLEALLHQFREVYKEFRATGSMDFERAEKWEPRKKEAKHGFRVVNEISTDDEDEKSSVRVIVKRAFQFFEILESYMEQYQRACDEVRNRIEHPTEHPLRQVIYLHSDVLRLVQSAELVPVNACEMMFQLLELIGMRNELGGLADVAGSE